VTFQFKADRSGRKTNVTRTFRFWPVCDHHSIGRTRPEAVTWEM